MTTALDSLVGQFVAGGWPLIAQLPLEKREESLHLDFKEKKDATTGALHQDDKKHLSIALSGFANADGGLLVWGVEARRDQDDVDRAIRVIPVKHVIRFRSELETITPDMVSFGVPGVEHHAISTSGDEDEGIVVTVVPRSDLAPHMATGKDLHSYYRRTSSRFQVMEHYEVADLFGRRPQPQLTVRCFWELVCTAPGVFQWVLQFMVENKGRGIARFPCLTLGHPPKGWSLLSATDQTAVGGPFKKVDPPHGWWLRYRGGADDVLHPGDRYNVASVAFALRDDSNEPTFGMEYELVAEGCPTIAGTFQQQRIDLGFFMTQLQPGQRLKSTDHPHNDPTKMKR